MKMNRTWLSSKQQLLSSREYSDDGETRFLPRFLYFLERIGAY